MIEAIWQKLWGKIFIVALFVFAIYSNINVILQNSQLLAQVAQNQAEVDQMTLRNQKLSLLLTYYQSPSYQDVEARARLGMKRPDETVYAVKGLSPSSNTLSDSGSIANSSDQSTSAESNFSLWLKYLSGKK